MAVGVARPSAHGHAMTSTAKAAEKAGAALEAKAETFRGVASGSGVEVPDWLERLSAAVDRAAEKVEAGGFEPQSVAGAERTSLPGAVPWVPMAWEAVHAALAT